jgi:taurine dioxygenase
MKNALHIDPVTPIIGAEISGIDLTGEISETDITTIKDALLEHQVIFFRDQELTIDQHKALGRRFGDLHIHPARYRNGSTDHPEILVVHADGDTTRATGDGWHSDVSCDAEPPMGSILHLFEIPPTGGDTLFASMYAAYDALSPGMKTYLGSLTATHDSGPNYTDRAKRTGHHDPARVYPANSHPVIRTHPETGRKAIFVNPIFTTEIDDVAKDESRAILDYLFAHIAKPAFHCRFRWARNSVAIWDNRCTIHQAMWDYFPQTRTGHRITIQGDKPR